MKSGDLNFMEPSGPLQACNGTDLPLPLPPDDEQQACSKHVEAYYWNKLIEKSASYWFMLYGYITMHGLQNIKFVITEFEIWAKCHWTIMNFSLINCSTVTFATRMT